MTRRTVIGGATAAPALVMAKPAQVSNEKPNLIQIVVDTWGTHWMGCYGASQVKTPNVDKLAAESVVFEDAYPESLPTLPARRVLYTGRRVFPSAMIPQPDDPVRIRGWHPLFAEDTTQSEALKAAGYTTAIISDVYHQFKPGKNFHRGFGCWRWIRGQEQDRVESGPLSAVDVSRYLHASQPAQNSGLTQYLLNRREWKAADDYFVARVFRDAARWLESSARETQPFYLHIESFSPHEYWDPPEEYYRMYMKTNYGGPRLIHPPASTANMSPVEVEHARALYAGLVTYVDAMIGELLRKAESMGLLSNTVVVLVGDHGTMMGEQGQLHKGETRIRTQVTHVPMMIRHPKVKARRVRGYAQHNDLMPTLLDLLGVTCPPRTTGESLRASIESGQEVRRESIVTGWGEHGAVRTPEWTYIGRWSEGAPFEELYDVRRDPLELRNVAAEHSSAVAEFRKRLNAHVAEGWRTTRGSFQS